MAAEERKAQDGVLAISYGGVCGDEKLKQEGRSSAEWTAILNAFGVREY